MVLVMVTWGIVGERGFVYIEYAQIRYEKEPEWKGGSVPLGG